MCLLFVTLILLVLILLLKLGLYLPLPCHITYHTLRLRNRIRKHVPCFYRVKETGVEVWENEKCCGNMIRRWVFPQCFEFFQTFTDGWFYNSVETQRTCFPFLLENIATNKRKTTHEGWFSKCKFSLLASSLCQQHVLVLCLHRVIETEFLTNRHT